MCGYDLGGVDVFISNGTEKSMDLSVKYVQLMIIFMSISCQVSQSSVIH